MEIKPRPPLKIEALLEPGFVFDPTDEDLVVNYLLRWISLKRLPCDIVIVDDIYRTEPWNLLREYQRKEEGYFFTQIKANRTAGKRKKRKAGEGSYTIQCGKDGAASNKRITWRKSTFSYKQKEEGERKWRTSGWVMHEYVITSTASEWVLCRVKLSEQEIARSKRRNENAIVAAE